MKRSTKWWVNVETVEELQTRLRQLEYFSVGCSEVQYALRQCKLTKEFMREWFNSNVEFEKFVTIELKYYGFIKRNNGLLYNIKTYMTYCNPSSQFREYFYNKLKKEELVKYMLQLKGVDYNNGHNKIGLRRKLKFYVR